MRKHFVLSMAVVAMATAFAPAGLRAAGQAPAAAPRAKATPTAGEKIEKAAAKTRAIKLLPDGTPDIRGAWTKLGGHLNEAKAPETPLKGFGVLAEPQGFGIGDAAAGPGGKSTGSSRGRAPSTTGMPPIGIVDPADRVLPYTPEGRAARLDSAKNMCCPAKAFEYVEPGMRCIPSGPNGAGNLYITQKPGEIALLFETNHQARIIYTDGRPHPSPAVTFFNGHSTGHWEGNTLVVETTNMDGRMYFGVGSTIARFSQELQFLERYTVVSDNLITYEINYIDPKTFTKPVKVVGYLAPPFADEEFVPEFTCHEGNYALIDVFGF